MDNFMERPNRKEISLPNEGGECENFHQETYFCTEKERQVFKANPMMEWSRSWAYE